MAAAPSPPPLHNGGCRQPSAAPHTAAACGGCASAPGGGTRPNRHARAGCRACRKHCTAACFVCLFLLSSTPRALSIGAATSSAGLSTSAARGPHSSSNPVKVDSSRQAQEAAGAAAAGAPWQQRWPARWWSSAAHAPAPLAAVCRHCTSAVLRARAPVPSATDSSTWCMSGGKGHLPVLVVHRSCWRVHTSFKLAIDLELGALFRSCPTSCILTHLAFHELRAWKLFLCRTRQVRGIACRLTQPNWCRKTSLTTPFRLLTHR